MFEGGPNSGGRASSSGIRPASSSGRKGSSGRQAALPGASGKRESVSDRLSSGRSSSMLSSSRLSAAADEAMAATISSRSAPVEAVPFKKMTRIGIVAMLLLIVVPLVVAVGVPQYKRWQKEKQALAERDLALAEALARLKEEQSAKRQDDLALALDRLKTLQNWEDVEKLLGKPSLQFQERIKLWDPVRGTYEQAGQEFRAYYIEDQAKSYQFEDVPLVPVLLFKVEGENKISLLGTHRYARRDTPPLQFHAPKEVQAAPDDAAPPPSDLPPEGQMEVPPNSPDAPPEMPSVSPDAPSPEVPPAPDGEAKTPEAQSP
ncbi:MAG: hypothetical protein M5U26_27760 [Planctomycetota bacterium]|nr:hypothetical protein [Planctomycetota bacterium]